MLSVDCLLCSLLAAGKVAERGREGRREEEKRGERFLLLALKAEGAVLMLSQLRLLQFYGNSLPGGLAMEQSRRSLPL